MSFTRAFVHGRCCREGEEEGRAKKCAWGGGYGAKSCVSFAGEQLCLHLSLSGRIITFFPLQGSILLSHNVKVWARNVTSVTTVNFTMTRDVYGKGSREGELTGVKGRGSWENKSAHMQGRESGMRERERRQSTGKGKEYVI